jgi:hypothetical protein
MCRYGINNATGASNATNGKGPSELTKYYANIHEMVLNSYAYAYDDGLGLLNCDDKFAYELTFY